MNENVLICFYSVLIYYGFWGGLDKFILLYT